MKFCVDNLTVSFNQKKIIDDMTFSMKGNEILFLLGKNGSGKTVTLKALSGLIDYISGDIRLVGENNNILASTPDDLRSKTTYVFQKGGLFDSMTVMENVMFGLLREGMSEQEALHSGMRALQMVGLMGNENKIPSELSGGMQKRVGLARAICMERPLRIFDDPTAGLDPVLTDSMGDLIVESREKKDSICFITTHDLRLVRRIADRVILIYKGKPVFNGTRDSFFCGENAYARQFVEGAEAGPISAY